MCDQWKSKFTHMKKTISILFLFFILGNTFVFAQVKTEDVLVIKDTLKSKDIDPLTPAKAAFYSAVLPGLGQVYNKKYWKVPLVYGALATSLYFYIDSDKKYNLYRNEYKLRLEGGVSEDLKFLTNDRLISAQKFYQRNRDLSALITVGIYVLNIVDANIDAALKQFNVDERLSIQPFVSPNDVTYTQNVGLTFNYRF
jgi:hypothetical protein